MSKITYDPALRKTEHGARLYKVWQRMRMFPHDPAWDAFPAFYAWAMSAGYNIGARLYRSSDSQPHGPENSRWTAPVRSEPPMSWESRWCEKWNKTVNKLRKHYGLPPLKEENHDSERF